MTTEPAPADFWNAPPGWKGEALAGFGDFRFHELPWQALTKEGDEAGGIRCVKSGSSRRVFRIELSGGGGVVFAKRYLINNWRRRFGNLFAGGKARHEFRLGHALLRAGLATPLPLAHARHLSTCRLDGAEPLPPAGYLLTKEWPNQGSAGLWIREHPDDKEAMAFHLGRFLARAHELGFYHDDCSAEHILVAPVFRIGNDHAGEHETAEAAAAFAFIDLDNGRLFDRPVAMRRRLVNLFQVLRSIRTRVFVAAHREAFLRAYLEEARLGSVVSLELLKQQIDRVAWRKAGRSVFRVKAASTPRRESD